MPYQTSPNRSACTPGRKRWLPLCVLLTAAFGFMGVALSQESEIDEDALFGDTAIMVDLDSLESAEELDKAHNEKSVSFSGRVISSVSAEARRSWFDSLKLSQTSFGATALGGLDIDVRLPNAAKAYGSAEALYFGANDSLLFRLNEIFVDWNIRRRAYFRFGKQILQWGRGYFFNPVDLVNVEKKRFFDDLTGREGALGLKMHIPFQTRANIYVFVDMDNANHIDSLAGAVKAEFLAGATEFAFSAWGKSNKDPVYGFDFSSRLGDFAILGETALFQSAYGLELKSDSTIAPKLYRWAPKISLGASRFFDIGDINDRLMATVEGYYNHTGIKQRSFSAPAAKATATGLSLNEFTSTLPIAFNDVSKWYAAAFVNVSRFIITDMSLNASALYNFNQRSALLTGGLSYTTLHNLSFEMNLSGFAGENYTEYTLPGKGLVAELRAGIRF